MNDEIKDFQRQRARSIAQQSSRRQSNAFIENVYNQQQKALNENETQYVNQTTTKKIDENSNDDLNKVIAY